MAGMLWLVPLVLWEAVWKGIALWFAAGRKQKVWFVAIFIFNTVGILPIVYLLLHREKKPLKLAKKPVKLKK